MSYRFGLDEWFVVELARTVHDSEVVFHGFGSPCATVAMHLAKRTHAPSALLIEGAMYAVNPYPAFIPPTSNDHSLKQGAVYSMRFEEAFDMSVRGEVDHMFLSGIQIDSFGNTNVTAIGPMPTPKVKLGGGGGGCNMSATIRRLTLWTTNHRPGRCLVEKCDFVTDLGHSTREGTRLDLGYTGGGPQALITELGVFDFPEGRARLRALFPDVTRREVAEATGFDYLEAPDLGPLERPTRSQIENIRTIDPLSVRRSEFRPAELERTFPL